MRWTAWAESSAGIRGLLPVEPDAWIRGLPPVEPGGGWDGIPTSGGVAAPWDKKGEETAALRV